MNSTSMSYVLRGAWLCAVTLACLFSGCHGKSVSTGDSETHFLASCSDSCEGGLTCVCGVCTQPCTESRGCGELSGAASCENSCSSTSMICDVACALDAECHGLGADFRCSVGRCRQAGSMPAQAAPGAGGAADSFDASGGAGADAGNAGASGMSLGGDGAAASGACLAAPDPEPRLPLPTELDPDLVARASAVLGSCLPDDGVTRNAAHLWLAHLAAAQTFFRFGEQLRCLADAACGCDAVERCLGWVYSAPPDGCSSSCSGDIFSGCGDGAQLTVDCSRFSLSCDAQAGCLDGARATCEPSQPPSCGPQGEVLFCDAGVLRQTPCQALGFACVDGKCVGGGAECVGYPTTEEVELVGTGCAGDTLQACVGGYATSVDCTSQGPGFGCRAFNGTFFCGLAAECEPSTNGQTTEPASCEGSRLNFCNAGRLEHLDCTTLGFSGCEIDTKVGHYGCIPGARLQ